MTSILLISNSKDIIEKFDKNLVLLRRTDSLSYCDYEDAPDVVFANRPDIVIVHEFSRFEKTLNLIKYIKTKDCSVLLMINKYSRDNVLRAYDEGIDDYFYETSDPSEILIKTVNCIKNKNLLNKLCEYEDVMKQFGIISKTTGFYLEKNAEKICSELFVSKEFYNGALILVASDENCKAEFLSEKIVKRINSILRKNDLILGARGSKFCIIIKDGGADGAVALFNKIKESLNGEFVVRAGICEIKKYTYQIAQKKAGYALSDAILSNRDFVIYSKSQINEDENWLEIPTESSKNYKIFRQTFCKKLEKVISPVFFRLQKDCESKLKNTKIEQYTDELQSVFRLINQEHSSLLKIVYPGFTKVVISVTHAGWDSPENHEIMLPVNKITIESLTEILENFISEFNNTVV